MTRQRRIPSLNWLRVFEAAARTGSFAHAAAALNMSPPAVSQQIRALEEHFQTQLFKRGPRSVELTEAGRAFLPTVLSSLASIDAAADSLFYSYGGRTLTVGVVTVLAMSWLSERLPAFFRDHPEIQVTLLTSDRSVEPSHPGSELVIGFGEQQTAGYEHDQLFGERLYPVAHPDIAAEIGCVEDLLRWRLIEIAQHRASWWRFLPEVDRLAAGPRFLFADNSGVALSLAGSGLGIALARAPATDALERRYGLVPCLPELSAMGDDHYHLIYPSRNRLSASALAFRTWLLAEAAPA